MKLSVRARLTLWYVTLLTVSLIVFGAAFFYALSSVYMSRIDGQIYSIADVMSRNIVTPRGSLSTPRNFDIVLEKFFGIRTGGYYIQVLDSKGDVAAKSSTLSAFDMPVSDSAYARALRGEDTYEIVKPYGVFPIRVISHPVRGKGTGLVGIVQVGGSLEGMEEISRYMVYFFIFGILASVAIASVIGAFLAKKALQPVKDITQIAKRITAESLGERIDSLVQDDEIGRLAATLNEMIARLERSFKQIKQFTADASHELKTPLTVMKGEVEISLRVDMSKEEMKETLVSLLEEIDRMSHIVQNLLTLARADMERGRTKLTSVRLDEILSNCYEQLRKLAAGKSIELSIVRNDYILVLSDPIRLNQVVYNLIENAIKYTDRGGKVDLFVNEEAGAAVLTVIDTGMGISDVDLPHIFDRFYRVDKARSREAAGGVGLGLSICKEIVESFDGKIEVRSVVGRGSTFRVVLPLAVSFK